MLVLCAGSDRYDAGFHIHLEDMEAVETDMDVTIRRTGLSGRAL